MSTLRFHPHQRLLRLLVGSNLYASPDAFVRELVQNAWDAIEWRRSRGDGAGGRIQIRYSGKGNWIEVADDGIGMTEHDVRESFLEVGQDKLLAIGEKAAAGEQVAFFGIGVLSVFLVAESIDVTTRKLGQDAGISFHIPDLEAEFEAHVAPHAPVGTTIKVNVRADAGMSPSNIVVILHSYVRHVHGVHVENADTGEAVEIEELWEVGNLTAVDAVDGIPALRSGRLGFVPGLFRNDGTISSRITLCNAGFLAESQALGLVTIEGSGMAGELDLHPRALNIVMSRERFQRDAQWAALSNEVTKWFADAAFRQLTVGELRRAAGFDSAETRRAILIWMNFVPRDPPFSQLREELEARTFETVLFNVSDGAPTTLRSVVEGLPKNKRVYFRRSGAAAQRRHQVNDSGFPVQWFEEVRDSVRVVALKANGYSVLQLEQFPVNVQNQANVSSSIIDELSAVSRCLSARGINVVDVSQAAEEDMDFQGVEQLRVLRNVVDVGGTLRFAKVGDSQRRIVSDSSGVRYLNTNNLEVRRLLKIMPSAVSNPLKQRLLRAYLGIEEFRLSEARAIIVALLESEDLGDLAVAETAVFTSEVVRRAVEKMMQEEQK